MPLYMAQFAYTPQAWAALFRVPQDRAAASDALVGTSAVGFEAPDDAAAAAVEIAAIALGHLRSNRLLRVLSAEEMQAALQQAATAPDIAPKRTADET
jgi:hypothetical protein